MAGSMICRGRYEVLGYLPPKPPFEQLLVRRVAAATGDGGESESAPPVLMQRAPIASLDESNRARAQRDAGVRQQLGNRCPYSVLFCESFEDDEEPPGHVCTVTEHCEVGSLDQLLVCPLPPRSPHRPARGTRLFVTRAIGAYDGACCCCRRCCVVTAAYIGARVRGGGRAVLLRGGGAAVAGPGRRPRTHRLCARARGHYRGTRRSRQQLLPGPSPPHHLAGTRVLGSGAGQCLGGGGD
jgi:hypothetical protein